MDAQLLFFFSDFESWRAFFHHQRCDSFFALGGVRIHISDSRVGRSAAGDPSLGAIDDIGIALLHRLRLQRRGVRAGLRLGQRVATDFFTSREWMQKFLLLFFGAEAMNRIAVQRILHGENHAGGRAAPRNLLDHDGVADVIEARAASALWKRHPGQPKFRRSFEQRSWKMPGLVVLLRQRPDFRLRKLAHAFLQQLLFFRQFEVHGRSLIRRKSFESVYFIAASPAG